MGHDTEVSAELKLDDHASEALHKIKEGFEHVNEKVKETAHEMVNMAKQAAAVAIGFQLSGMVNSFKELAEEAFHGAEELENEKKELAGLVMLTDKGATSFDEAQGKAGELNEKLEDMAMRAGVAKRDMVEAFEMIAQRSTRGTEAVADMTAKMAMASRAMPGGMSRMAEGWRDLEMGFIRPRNSLVMLMKQAGVVEGPIRKVAKELNAMMQSEGGKEHVFSLAEDAITKMAEKTKAMPPTFSMMANSLKNIREHVFEVMGTPMVAAIMPPLERLKNYLMEHREQIEKLAETLGTKVGEWVGEAADKIQQGFNYLQTHADDILNALESGGHALMTAVKFMVDHKEILLALVGGKMLAGAGGGLGMGGAGGGQAMPGLMGAGVMLGTGQGGGWGGEAGRMGAGIGGMAASGGMMFGPLGAAAGAAAGAVAELTHQIVLLAGESHDDTWADVNAKLARMNEELTNNADLTDEQLTELSRWQDQVIELSSDIDTKMVPAIRAQMDAMYAQHHALQEQTAAAKAAAELAANGDPMGMAALTASLRKAQGIHDKASQEFIAHFLEKHIELRNAFFAGAGSLGEGVGALLNLMTETDAKTKELLTQMAAPTPGKDDKPPPSQFSLSGGGPVNITMHQDFRDQDPDRIALIFNRHLQREAVASLQAKTALPLGL